MKRVLIVSMAMLMMSASAALAGTKYQANLVSVVYPGDPNDIGDMDNKGKIQVKDTGDVKVGLKGVLDGTGAPVTTSQSWKDAKFADPNAIDATQYVAILKLDVKAVPGALAEYVVPVDLKNGNGSTKINLSGLISLLEAVMPATRAMEIVGGEVWGPLGSAVATCKNVLVTGELPGVPGVQYPNSTACRGGAQIGVAGISIP